MNEYVFTDGHFWKVRTIHNLQHVGSQHMVNSVPHGDECFMVAPIQAHVAESFPQRGAREALVAGH